MLVVPSQPMSYPSHLLVFWHALTRNIVDLLSLLGECCCIMERRDFHIWNPCPLERFLCNVLFFPSFFGYSFSLKRFGLCLVVEGENLQKG